MHERLRVDVLVVLGEVEPAPQRLIDNAAVVAPGQAKLRLHRRSEQRPSEFIEPLTLDDDAGRRPVESLHVSDRQAHVLEPERLERLETKYVADDGGGEVCDRPRLEQVQVIGDIGEILAFRARNRVDAIALASVLLAGGEPVRPHHGPGRRRGFPCYRRRRLSRIDPLLWGHAEAGDDVRVFRLVVGLEVTHLLVFHHPRLVAILAFDGL